MTRQLKDFFRFLKCLEWFWESNAGYEFKRGDDISIRRILKKSKTITFWQKSNSCLNNKTPTKDLKSQKN